MHFRDDIERFTVYGFTVILTIVIMQLPEDNQVFTYEPQPPNEVLPLIQ